MHFRFIYDFQWFIKHVQKYISQAVAEAPPCWEHMPRDTPVGGYSCWLINHNHNA